MRETAEGGELGKTAPQRQFWVPQLIMESISNERMRVPVAPHQHLILSFFLILAILLGVLGFPKENFNLRFPND